MNNLLPANTPLISVLLPVYNGEKYLAEAIDSVLVQTFTNFELIIIDDGSTDNSFTILQEYQRRDARIRLITRENRNLATTLNDCIALAQGTWIARMDQDDISLPQRFERQLDWLEKTGVDLTGSWAKIFGSWDRRTWKGYQTDEAIKMDILFKSPFFHSSVMMRTGLVRELNYNKAFEKAEDYDLWIRAAQAGWKMSNVPEVLLLYRKHNSQITVQSLSRQQDVAKKLQKIYWTYVSDLMGLNQDGVQEFLRLPSATKPNIDIVESMLKKILLQSKEEAKKAILDNVFLLYLRVGVTCSGMGNRWEKLNQEFGQSSAIDKKIIFWIVGIFRISYGDKTFNTLKKIYTLLHR